MDAIHASRSCALRVLSRICNGHEQRELCACFSVRRLTPDQAHAPSAQNSTRCTHGRRMCLLGRPANSVFQCKRQTICTLLSSRAPGKLMSDIVVYMCKTYISCKARLRLHCMINSDARRPRESMRKKRGLGTGGEERARKDGLEGARQTNLKPVASRAFSARQSTDDVDVLKVVMLVVSTPRALGTVYRHRE